MRISLLGSRGNHHAIFDEPGLPSQLRWASLGNQPLTYGNQQWTLANHRVFCRAESEAGFLEPSSFPEGSTLLFWSPPRMIFIFGGLRAFRLCVSIQLSLSHESRSRSKSAWTLSTLENQPLTHGHLRWSINLQSFLQSEKTCAIFGSQFLTKAGSYVIFRSVMLLPIFRKSIFKLTWGGSKIWRFFKANNGNLPNFTVVSRKTTYKVLTSNLQIMHFREQLDSFRTLIVLLCSI